MVWIEGEPGRLVCPGFADGLVRRQAAQGLQTALEVIGGDEVGEVLPELIVAVVVGALDGRVLDRAVHPLDLAIGPRMAGLGQAVLDVEMGTGAFEGVAAEENLVGSHLLDLSRRPGLAGRFGEVCSIIGQHGVDRVGNGGGKSSEEVTGDTARGLLVQFHEGELGRAVDGHKEIQLALCGSNLGNVDVEVSNRVGLPRFCGRLGGLAEPGLR